MRYRVYVADKFTKMPLISYKVSAISKWHAKSKVYKMCGKDKSCLYIATKIKGGDE